MDKYISFLKKAMQTRRERKSIEFKEGLNVESTGAWCEIIKDIVAIANSGGGLIIFGVKDNGLPSDSDISHILKYDLSNITNKIAKYTKEQFSDFEIIPEDWFGKKVAVMFINGVSIPLVFNIQGNYTNENGKQKSAFNAGTIYFRHGAKSETADYDDIRQFIDRQIKKIRKTWYGNIRKIVDAPSGYKVKVLPPEVKESALDTATPIRIVDDPRAPAYRKLDPNITHPFRQKEVINSVNLIIGDNIKVTQYDILCVRRLYDIEDNARFFYKPKYASPQYSQNFIDWIITQFNKDNEFFQKAKSGQKID